MKEAVYKVVVSAHEAEPSSHRDLSPPGLGEGGPLTGWRDLPRRGRGLSLSTLIIIRWLAILGQTSAILTAYFALHFDLPLAPCLHLPLPAPHRPTTTNTSTTSTTASPVATMSPSGTPAPPATIPK